MLPYVFWENPRINDTLLIQASTLMRQSKVAASYPTMPFTSVDTPEAHTSVALHLPGSSRSLSLIVDHLAVVSIMLVPY